MSNEDHRRLSIDRLVITVPKCVLLYGNTWTWSSLSAPCSVGYHLSFCNFQSTHLSHQFATRCSPTQSATIESTKWLPSQFSLWKWSSFFSGSTCFVLGYSSNPNGTGWLLDYLIDHRNLKTGSIKFPQRIFRIKKTKVKFSFVLLFQFELNEHSIRHVRP